MKVLELRIENLRKISDAVLKFDKPLVCLFGEVEQGKTTFLDAIKILFSKGFPADLIQHGKEEAGIRIILERGEISRTFYIDKKGETKGRALNAIIDNKTMKASSLYKLFNPFQLNQDFLKEKTGLERKRFFVELFNVDTSIIDDEIKKHERAASDLRIEISAFGEIDLTFIKKPNIDDLTAKELAEKKRLNAIVKANRAENVKIKEAWKVKNDAHIESIKKFNNKQQQRTDKLNACALEVSELKLNHLAPFFNLAEATTFIEALPKPEEIKPLELLPDPTLENEQEGCDASILKEIQAEISESKADIVRYDNYIESLKKQKNKDAKKEELLKIGGEIKRLRTERTSKLSEYGKEIEGLRFDENGEMNFEGTVNDNLSTSQIVRLGSLLSRLYPDSLLDLELIDRGESLGKKIWEFIEKAERENKTILATIVGEKPAATPDGAGVFVVENGQLT